MIFLVVMNMQAASRTNYIALLRDDIEIMTGTFQNQKEILEEPDLTEQDELEISEANTVLEENIELIKQSIHLAEVGKWKESLTIQIKQMEENVLFDIENGNIPDHEIFVMDNYMRYASYKKLSELNEEPQIDGLEMKGGNYVYRMMDSLFPIIFSLCLIALISNIVCASVIDKIDIEALFPENPIKFHLRKIALLTAVGILSYFFFLAVSFILTSLLNGMGTAQYPINIYEEGFSSTKPLIEIILKGGLLQLLSILFIISCVYLISIIVKSGLTTLFVSTVILSGGILLTGQIAPMAKYLHFLPTTYINAIRVVTNQLAYENVNAAITFQNGILVLASSSLIVVLIIVLMKIRSRKKEMLGTQLS